MSLSAKEIIHRLGPAGLSRALDDLLDQSHVVRLANACGLEYPGRRTQTQTRERLLADLVDRADKRENVRKAILRMLQKETADAMREWSGLDPEEKARRLCDDAYLGANGRIGLHLYLLASTEDRRELDRFGAQIGHARLLGIASNGTDATEDRKSDRENARLLRQIEQRDRKVRHLDGQLAKSRESHKAVKSDLIQRKGELAESRMLAERLRRELAQATAQIAAAGKPGGTASEKAVNELTRAVRRLASEQRTLTHRVDKFAVPAAGASRKKSGDATLEAIKKLQAELAALATGNAQDRESYVKQVEALRSELRARPQARPSAAPTRRTRPRGQARRVGVFIDVQNVYYAARKLKGKLDFDALLQAAVQGRRLIKATAYVVESKETDQSQFIARLQARAIEVQRKTLRVRADGSMKGDWDMELALDILDSAPKLDVVVLVSGDGDFTSLVKRVKGMGPRVEVIAFPRNTAKSLVEAADRFQPLDRKFMIYTRAKTNDQHPAKQKATAPADTSRPASTAGKPAAG